MDALTLCLLRRTNKQIDDFVESNRFQISAQFRKPMGIMIYLDDSADPLCGYRVGQVRCETLFNDRSYNPEYFYSQSWPLTDPYKQTSALKFEKVFVMFYERHPGLIAYPGEHTDKQALLFKQQVLPLLPAIRLNTDVLHIYRCPIENIAPLLSSIRYSRLFILLAYGHHMHLDILLTWQIDKNCIERHLGIFWNEDIPFELGPLIRNYKKTTLIYVVRQTIIHLFTQFLQEIRFDREARGNLEFFHFHGAPAFHFSIDVSLDGVEGLDKIWQGTVHGKFWETKNGYIRIYKMKIADGSAIIIHNYANDYFTYIRDKDDREDLFSVLAPLIFLNAPIDFSSVFDDFLSASSDQDAIQSLHAIIK